MKLNEKQFITEEEKEEGDFGINVALSSLVDFI